MPLSDSGATVADIAASDPSQNLRLVYGVLTGLGVPPKTALGAMTSLAGESGGKLSTAAINRGDGSDGSDSIGFGQWNGPRARALKATATQMGLPVTDIRAQAAHLADELQGPYHNVLAALQAKDDAAYGAGIWTADYERPAVNNTAARLRFLPQIAKALGAGPVTGLDAIAQATGTPQAPVTRGIAPLAFAEPQKPQGETPQQTYSRIAFQQPAQASAPSDDDLLNAFGGNSPTPAAPVTPAATPKAPAGTPANGAVSDDDLLSAFAGPPQAAEKPAAPTAPAAAIPDTSKLLDPGQAKQDLQDVATAGTAFGEGIPIIGGALRYMQAGSGAAASYLINPFLSEEDQSKGTFGERYNRLLGQRDAQMEAFKEGHPVENAALNIAGGVTALGPVAATELGGAALGVRGGNILTRTLAGGASGAALGGADAAIRGQDPLSGATWGGIFGAAAPAAGQIIGSGVNALLAKAEGIAPAASTINRLLGEIGMTPQQARQAAQRMGPNATLADINPALTTEAGAVAAQGGEPTSVLRGFMAGRAAQADNRVAQAIDASLGPKPDLNAELEAGLQRARQQAAPYYQAAAQTAQPMNTIPLLADINVQLRHAVGGEANILRTIQGYLIDRTVPMPGPNGGIVQMPIPKQNPGDLLRVRQALDDYIQKLPLAETSAGRNATATANRLRGDLDRILKSDPNIAQGDAVYAGEMRLRDAMQEGTELFTRGVRPEDFARTLQRLGPQEIDAMRAGARVAIGDALEQARQGALQGARSMFGRATANRAKLDALFPNAGGVFDMLQSEAAMRATEQRVAQNSVTAERLNAGQRYRPGSSDLTGDAVSGAAGMLLGDPSGGLATALVKRGGNALLNAMSGDYYNRLTSGAARGLSATGPALDDFVQAMERAGRLQAGNAAVSNGANVGANLLLNAIANQKRVAGGNRLLSQ